MEYTETGQCGARDSYCPRSAGEVGADVDGTTGIGTLVGYNGDSLGLDRMKGNFMNPNYIRRVAAAVLMLVVGLVHVGCAHTSGGGAAVDTVSGYYAGDWFGPNPEKSLGSLNCTITAKGADSWDAHFVATFGEVGEYKVPLEGKRVDGKVIFGGDVDLGESEGGVFGWTGEIVGDEFNGVYKAAGYTGTFRMVRADPPTE